MAEPSGDDVHWHAIEFVFDTTRAVTHLVLSGTLERCPDLRLIVPHAGGTIPYLAERIHLIASRFVPGTTERAPAGVKAYFRQLYYDLAISTSPHAVASLLQLANTDHILFGSDYPALSEEDIQSLTQALVDNPLLQPGALEMIQRHNALPWPAAAMAFSWLWQLGPPAPGGCDDPGRRVLEITGLQLL